MDTPAKHSSPRDVFLHLLAIIFLYVCVFNIGALLFQYINIAFPDVLAYDSVRWARAGVRWPLAILVIVFPCYVWLTSTLQAELQRDPEKRELRTRKWLLHFTLFLTAIVIIGDLVTLMYQFLSGGLSVRFILKVVVVLAIALSTFLYYGWCLRKVEPPSSHPGMKLFTRLVVVLVAIAIIAGFFIAGSPFAERQRQFDDRRVSDLSSLQWQLISYWQSKEELPATIDALRDEISGFIPPTDPRTGKPYEYSTTGDETFELCAEFELATEEDANRPVPVMDPYGNEDVWSHGAGRHCFQRTIDPDRYPPLKNVR